MLLTSLDENEELNIWNVYNVIRIVEETFWLYKNIIDRDTVNVHNDYRTYATEFVNFLAVIITTRVKKLLVKTEISKKYSYKMVFKFLSKYKKVKARQKGPWTTGAMLKYVEELVQILDV